MEAPKQRPFLVVDSVCLAAKVTMAVDKAGFHPVGQENAEAAA